MTILPSTTSTSMFARLFVVVFFKKGALTLPVPIPDEEKKIMLNFYLNTTLRNVRNGKGT